MLATALVAATWTPAGAQPVPSTATVAPSTAVAGAGDGAGAGAGDQASLAITFDLALASAQLESTAAALTSWEQGAALRQYVVRRLSIEQTGKLAEAEATRRLAATNVVDRYIAVVRARIGTTRTTAPTTTHQQLIDEYSLIAGAALAGRSGASAAQAASAGQLESQLTTQVSNVARYGLWLAEAELSAELTYDTARDQLVSLPTVPGSAPPVLADPSALPIRGPGLLSTSEIAGWYSSVARDNVTHQDAVTLAQLYLDEGAAEGIRGDVAFAQAMHETDGLSITSGANNFAGIGACDSCAHGYSYPSVRLGVRAQIELLRAYADPTYTQQSTARLASYQGINTLPVRGLHPTWDSLSGVWSSGLGYGPSVLWIYRSMVSWALAHPGV